MLKSPIYYIRVCIKEIEFTIVSCDVEQEISFANLFKWSESVWLRFPVFKSASIEHVLNVNKFAKFKIICLASSSPGKNFNLHLKKKLKMIWNSDLSWHKSKEKSDMFLRFFYRKFAEKKRSSKQTSFERKYHTNIWQQRRSNKRYTQTRCYYLWKNVTYKPYAQETSPLITFKKVQKLKRYIYSIDPCID